MREKKSIRETNLQNNYPVTNFFFVQTRDDDDDQDDVWSNKESDDVLARDNASNAVAVVFVIFFVFGAVRIVLVGRRRSRY